jgi:archaellum component FlaC
MIERQQEAIKQDINTLRQETRETTNEISSRLESRAGELGARVQQVRDDIREAAASLIHIEVVGVWLFGVGSFLSTFSKEISECSFLIG